MKDEIQEQIGKIKEIMKEFETKIKLEKVKVEKEFTLETTAGEYQYKEEDIIRVRKELVEENDKSVPILT